MGNECCARCMFIHRMKHNFEASKGFQESYCCDVLMHIDDGEDGWIQEVTPHGMCEMFTEVKQEKINELKENEDER